MMLKIKREDMSGPDKMPGQEKIHKIINAACILDGEYC